MRNMPFASRDQFYKSAFGSVPSGTPFHLRVLLPCDGYVLGAVAVFYKDGGDQTRFELLPDGPVFETPEGFCTRGCDIALDEGLYFYDFIMYTRDGERRLLDMGGGVGEFDPPNGKPWQLTVYHADFKTPDWVKGGIIYQIFPDRFNKSGEVPNFPPDRYYQADWAAMPEYRQPENDEKKRLGNDYYGGNLKGITEKLDYLADLGVTIIYLNPIFEAHSNHRYNTADYFKIDPMLGTEQDFITLCKTAKKHGIAIVLDGVFSHTGDDSVYFNKYGRYGSGGAYNDAASRYREWFKFEQYPTKYHAWWGVPSLPETCEDNADFTEFITGKNGVLRYWLRRGAMGFRLDVADELPDRFLDKVRAAIKAENKDAFLIGEVWEDASNKISYGARRRFIRGRQLDSVMNYPFANAIIDFLQNGNGLRFKESVLQILENYPQPVLDVLMNHIGTHDTARILTALCGEPTNGRGREWQAQQTLSPDDYSQGVNKLCAAALLQYTLVGVPSLYYGDEAGQTGYGDPFCRAAFNWQGADQTLTAFYKKLGAARRSCKAFCKGNLQFLCAENGVVAYLRTDGESKAFVAVNRTEKDVFFTLPFETAQAAAVFGLAPKENKIKVESNGIYLLVE